jgi:uncharacterized protein with HEPN domain
MRDDLSRLRDLLEAADLVASFASGRTRLDLDLDRQMQSAMLHQLYVIGEAAARISSPLRDRYPSIPWSAVRGFRNYIAHEYFSLDLDIVWQTATDDVPKLRLQIAEIIQAEFSDLNP